MEFDLIGVDAAIANALRRMMLAEVPTVAIETVWFADNTSIIQDEVLAHRIGLIPLKIDPKKLSNVVNGEETDQDTIVLYYNVECTNEKEIKPDGTEGYVNETAYSGSLTWVPQGEQEKLFPEGIRPVHDDIVLAKLRPGQRIEFEAHCRRGVGKDHTKYSPVATASYRLLPVIDFQQKVTGKDAKVLKEICPMNVFDIEDLGGVSTATVARPRDCSMCRECIRQEGWSERVRLRRKADHFLFSVESVGNMAPEVIVQEAIKILKEKAVKFRNLVDEYNM
jgi:DNA-directed RNA polymerase I and III subunit RPAC1